MYVRLRGARLASSVLQHHCDRVQRLGALLHRAFTRFACTSASTAHHSLRFRTLRPQTCEPLRDSSALIPRIDASLRLSWLSLLPSLLLASDSSSLSSCATAAVGMRSESELELELEDSGAGLRLRRSSSALASRYSDHRQHTARVGRT